jgi:hypothetical protein
MPDSMPVAARVHPEVGAWIEQKADRQKTTNGRVVEQMLSELYQEQNGGSSDAGEVPSRMRERVYEPDSKKYDYALRMPASNSRDRKYYKTKSGVIDAYERFYE